VENGEKLRSTWTSCLNVPHTVSRLQNIAGRPATATASVGLVAGRELAMEPVIPLLIASFLDPVRALITFGCTFLSRKYGVLAAALASSIVCETILAAAQGWHYWGQGILPGFIVSLLQAALLFCVVRMVRRRVWRHAN
jgi:hypothetical protein